MTLKKMAMKNTVGKKRKCWLPAFSPFPTLFSTLSRRKITIFGMFNLSSANAFNLVTPKFLSLGKALNDQYTHFKPNTEMCLNQ